MFYYKLETNGVFYSGTLKELEEMGRQMKSEYVIYKYHQSKANDKSGFKYGKWMGESEIIRAQGMLERGYPWGTVAHQYRIGKELLKKIIAEYNERTKAKQ